MSGSIPDFKIFMFILMMGVISAFPARAGWLSSWFAPSSETQETAPAIPSPALGTTQPPSLPAQYGGPRVLTVSPKNRGGATEITVKDLEMQQKVISDRMMTNVNMMEMILKNRAVAEAAKRDAEKIARPSLPTTPTQPGVRDVAAPVKPVMGVTNYRDSHVIAPILPAGLTPILPKSAPGTGILPPAQAGQSGIQPILPNVAKPAPAVKKDNKP